MCDKAEGGDKPVEENSVSRSDLQEQRFQILKGLESFSRAMEPKLRRKLLLYIPNDSTYPLCDSREKSHELLEVYCKIET